jgi:hypothetical protein
MDGNLRRAKLAGADAERVLPAGDYDQRWIACTTPPATLEGKLDVLRIEPQVRSQKCPIWARTDKTQSGPGCLNRLSASMSGASALVRPPSGEAAG